MAALALALLPYEAYNSVDAILRTTWRVLVSRRRLLQWSPFAGQGRKETQGLLASVRSMWIAPVLALAAGALLPVVS